MSAGRGSPAARPQAARAAIRALGRSAVAALYAELALEPKPGLVSLIDSGSHSDMDATTFLRSLFALRSYFASIAEAGADDAGWSELQALGIEAERRMLRATGGVNTHRGAIFLLGLLCASAGRLLGCGRGLTPAAIRAELQARWGGALAAHAGQRRHADSNGARAVRAHRLCSIADEAAAGFPVLFEHALPALQAARADGRTERAALVQALLAAMAGLDDTTLVHRGGIEGLRRVRAEAAGFLAAGGTALPDWRGRIAPLQAHCLARRLSPGGAADTLAAAWWLARVTARSPQRDVASAA